MLFSSSSVYVFINLFIAPMLTMIIVSKLNNRKMERDFGLLLQYGALIMLNIPLTMLIAFWGGILFAVDITAESPFYTICAIISASLLGIIIELCRRNMKGRNK